MVLFQTSMPQYAVSKSKLSYFKQFSLAYVYSLFLFDPSIGSYQVLPLWANVDLGAMAIKGYNAFPKAPALLEPHPLECLVSYPGHSLDSGGLTPLQLVYSTAAADSAKILNEAVYISPNTYNLGKGMNQTSLSQAISK